MGHELREIEEPAEPVEPADPNEPSEDLIGAIEAGVPALIATNVRERLRRFGKP
jgi:hypothetical protein